MKLYRLYDRKYALDPISGRGAYQIGGRWNERGTAALYTSSTPELAILESVFRLTPDNLPDYNLLILEVEDNQIQRLNSESLPPSWRDRQYSNRPIQRVLAGWFRDKSSMGIVVPSALVPLSVNVVLNPLFSGYETALTIIDNSAFTFE